MSSGLWLAVFVAFTMAAAHHQEVQQAQQVLWRPAILPGLDLFLPVPEENPLTPEKVELGRRLFSDTILSRDNSVSCATCHVPELSFTDGRAVPRGVEGRLGRRSAPTLVNRGYGRAHFWDGRAARLEQQALGPFDDPNEFDLPVDGALTRLRARAEYASLFEATFGSGVNAQNLAQALAAYVRTIISGAAPIDRYHNGDRDALGPLELEGLRLFRGKAKCVNCHVGPTFTDEEFHNTGVAWLDGMLTDPGRGAVTGKQDERGAFKTPTLREVSRTAPYMHDGSMLALEDVVEYYDRGGNANPYIDPELRPLHLTSAEKRALVAFLCALTGTVQEGKLRPIRP